MLSALKAEKPFSATLQRTGSHPKLLLVDDFSLQSLILDNPFFQGISDKIKTDIEEELPSLSLQKQCSEPVYEASIVKQGVEQWDEFMTSKIRIDTETNQSCAICYTEIKDESHMKLVCCKPTHIHVDCAFQFILINAENVFAKMRCPVGCERILKVRDIHQTLSLIKKIKINTEITKDIRRYLAHNRIFSSPQKLFICPTDGCLGVLDRTGTKNECECCQTAVCLKCDRKAHPEIECVKTMEEEKEVFETKFKTLVVERKYQVCPGCMKTVERTQGCRDMNCICGTEFCYDCGKILDWNYPEGEQYCRCVDDQEEY